MVHTTKKRRYIFGSLLAAAIIAGWMTMRATEDEFVVVTVNGAAVRIEIAASEQERTRGLSGRNILPQASGMFFLFGKPDYHGIWMKDMKFPIDILWLSEDSVVDIEERVQPAAPGTPLSSLQVYTPDMPVRFVLEVNAGFVERHGIRIGDPIKIPWSDLGFPEGPPVQRGRNWESSSIEGLPQKPPGNELFIETLRGIPPQGSGFSLEARLPGTSAYDSFLFSYKSGDFILSGVMTVPRNAGVETHKDGSGSVQKQERSFPVLILNHGLIHPSIYYSGRGSSRERDFFARNGYVTIHPDYRGYGLDAAHACPPTLSFTSEGCRHDFYVGYTADVVNLIDALRRVQLPYVDLSRIGMWGHSMGGGIASRVAVLRPDIRAYVLFAPISADVEDNFYELPEEEISRLAQVYGTGGAARERYKKASPLVYFEDLAAPVQLHHGTEDKDVPIEFSERMYMMLKEFGKTVEFFVYPGQAHEFSEDWQLAAERALQFFDLYVKAAQ